ncbi:MAG TPA: FAD-dependent oxidoreductase [Solirubrobacterales bacterium]|nr:FAD-dependent oxidoreductase [Solirubrobacterales bacterium]
MTEDAVGIRVLFAIDLDEVTEGFIQDERIVYRPDLDGGTPSMIKRALAEIRPDILIAGCLPEPEVAAGWRDAVSQGPLLAIGMGRPGEADTDLVRIGIASKRVGVDTDGLGLLALAERTWCRLCTAADLPRKLAGVRKHGGRSVLMAGAGVVNLITALDLGQAGYEIDVYDSGPDPRGDSSWTEFGCTRGGENARMFTLTEGDDYHDKQYSHSGSLNSLFDHRITEGGWRICDSLSTAEMEWVDDFRSVHPWLAHAYTDDIFMFNREGGELWGELREHEAGLFEDVALRDGILRLYTDEERFRKDVARQDRVGATRRVLSVGEIGERYPGLAAACGQGEIVGGIEVVGFTLAVHDLVKRILAWLERHRVTFHWSTRVDAVGREPAGRPEGLMVNGESVRADHYVVSPGTYGTDLLRGTSSADLIHGVLGVWLTLPNTPPMLEQSLKIARSGHLAEDSNVTIGRDIHGDQALIIGSGYGWTGADPANIDAAQLKALQAAVDDTARRFFPEAYAAGEESGAGGEELRFCVRPWTASNLPVFEIEETSAGGALVVTGGHNTGGFAQAPAVAAATRAALEGRHHAMHVLYDPRRPRNFRNRGVAPAAT